MNLIKKPSPNYESRKGIIPCLIVDHITGGDRASSALNWFANPQSQTSSNYIVDTNGDVYECVPLEYAAWANGTTTVSTSKVYYGNAANPVVKQRGGNANLYSVSIEHVNEWGGNLTEKQLAATIELHQYIRNEIKHLYGYDLPLDRDHITGHGEVCPKSRPDNSCPGKSFPFEKILSALKGEGSMENKTIDVSWDASTVNMKAGDVYEALCIPRTLPDKVYYGGGIEVRCTEPDVLTITKVVQKYTSRKGQTGDLYTIKALRPGEARLIANTGNKTSSILIQVKD